MADADAPVCRICYEGSDEGVLLRPCACTDSIGSIHAHCLSRWLETRPELISRGCDVCKSPWDCVRTPTLREFMRDHDWRSTMERLLRYIVNTPSDDDDEARAAQAAAALTRLALRGAAYFLAVKQGRVALKLFAVGVRCVLVVDSRVDALLLPDPVADYLALLFPGLPCLQSAVTLGQAQPPPSFLRRIVARVAFKATPEVVSQPNLGTDLTVGLLMLALDARYLKNRVMALRRHEPLSRMLPRALALIVAEPGGICEDIGTVVDHLVTSPLLVLHWLCVFPSYVYALRLLLARCGVLAADARTLDLESGEGVAWHVALLAGAACAGTLVASLVRGLLGEQRRWAARYVLRDLQGARPRRRVDRWAAGVHFD